MFMEKSIMFIRKAWSEKRTKKKVMFNYLDTAQIFSTGRLCHRTLLCSSHDFDLSSSFAMQPMLILIRTFFSFSQTFSTISLLFFFSFLHPLSSVVECFRETFFFPFFFSHSRSPPPKKSFEIKLQIDLL